MLTIIKTAIALGTAFTLSVSSVGAQGRHHGARKERTEHNQSARRDSPKSNHKREATPGRNDHKKTDSYTRPGRGSSDKNNYRRPGNSNNVRPPQQHPSNPKPPQQHQPPQSHRPPHHAMKPTPRPPMMPPPHRPSRPSMLPYHRPVPPPAWRPRPSGPSFASILGLTFGTAIGLSLDYLTGNGYVVDGYDQDVVYLRNVNQLNLNWPDATLFYGPGGLTSSQFIYSTPAYDPYRYNLIYRRLVDLYGAPVSTFRPSGGFGATWFGPSSAYIQLEFKPMVANSGVTRFYTTLQFGN